MSYQPALQRLISAFLTFSSSQLLNCFPFKLPSSSRPSSFAHRPSSLVVHLSFSSDFRPQISDLFPLIHLHIFSTSHLLSFLSSYLHNFTTSDLLASKFSHHLNFLRLVRSIPIFLYPVSSAENRLHFAGNRR